MFVFWELLLMTPALKTLLSSHCLPPTPNKFVEMGQGRNPGESSLVIYGLSSVNCACPKLMGLGGKGKDNGLACFLLKCAPSSDSLFAGTIEWWLFLARKFISQFWISGTKASRLWILSVVRSPLQHLWALVSVCFSLEPFWFQRCGEWYGDMISYICYTVKDSPVCFFLYSITSPFT